MGIKAIGVVGNASKSHVVESIARLSEWAAGKGLEVLLEKEAAARLGTRGYHGDELGSRADLVVTMGGDGTLLQAARIMRKSSVPILGVNMGTFGYLTVINLNEMFDALEGVLAGDYRTESRMMLDAAVRDERGEGDRDDQPEDRDEPRQPRLGIAARREERGRHAAEERQQQQYHQQVGQNHTGNFTGRRATRHPRSAPHASP